MTTATEWRGSDAAALGVVARDRGGEAAPAPRDRLPLRLLRRRAVLHGLRRAPRLGLRGPAAARRLVAWLVRHTLGTSLLAMRLPSALAGAALVLLTGLLAREMGGGRFAMGLSAARERPRLRLRRDALPLHDERVRAAVLDGVRVRRRADRQDRATRGCGSSFGAARRARPAEQVLDGRLRVRPRGRRRCSSPERRAFAQPWIWLGGALAFLVFLPNVIWNVQHGWPFFELMRNIRASGRDVVLGPVEYVAAAGPQHEPRQPAGLARRPRLAPLLGARPRLPAPRLGVPGDARDVRGHEGQGLLPGPRLRHPLRRGRRRASRASRKAAGDGGCGRPSSRCRP